MVLSVFGYGNGTQYYHVLLLQGIGYSNNLTE
ncbi:DEHA2F16214p [Debaryomyces hansenii CBS767]|uniref:DEHA2F16214p n=1 Tax=Debaryomyces hansenii (strain ATCC 36239 / CBS 767 / BCRC 21394 / JCM 1990 / NBRC 0083 / IGC 2968) TaxID=284592 RepID=B5RUH7_DEBHA|nr:DEHA2F16214p [Debaryomyces hansenii CBS767]CAR66355.1 DEHA2F16214p [Debaryomyces hansenii CBS767]|eukprot:XP_002770833.1 DEHA2F16214p [Debaryomyces hansenii CBS767]